jgi:hypothetical protein
MKLPEPPPPELDAEMRGLIDAARSGHEPSELNRARVRRGVEIKLAAGIALAVAPASTALAGVAKVTAAVVAVSAVVGTGVYVYPRYIAKHEASRPAAHVAPRAPAAAPLPPVEVPPVVEAPPAPRAPNKRRVVAAPPPPVVESASRLKEETALLAAANAALGRGDVKRALALLDDYDRGPGAGVLAEERAVTGILASCAAGRVDAARVETRRFHARWPRSPLAARVDASCAGKR